MKSSRNEKKAVYLFVAVCVMCLSILFIGKLNVQAATSDDTEYTNVFDGVDENKPVKCGKYYVKYMTYTQNPSSVISRKYVYVSKYKNKGYKRAFDASYSWCIYSDGTKIYYTGYTDVDKSKGVLYKYVFRTGKNVKLTEIPLSEKYFGTLTICYAYGDYVVMNRHSEGYYGNVYLYNTKTGKKKEVKGLANVIAGNGEYFVTSDKYKATEDGRTGMSLWKFTKNGAKKITQMAKHSCSYGTCTLYMHGNNYYYIDFKKASTSDTDNTAVFYQCSMDGSNIKKLCARKEYLPDSNSSVVDITSKYYTYTGERTWKKVKGTWYTYKKVYKYTYATKKTTYVKTIKEK